MWGAHWGYSSGCRASVDRGRGAALRGARLRLGSRCYHVLHTKSVVVNYPVISY
jgi:hypothetical protein